MKQTKQQTFEKVYQMPLSKVYPLLVDKATRKGRTQEEVNEIICWLTGYSSQQLEELLNLPTTYGDFFRNAPAPNPNRKLIKGSICGIRVEEIQEPLMHLRHPCGRNSRAADAGNTLPGQAGRRTGERKTHGENPKDMNRQTHDMPTASRYFPSTSIVCICLLVVPNRLP